jgi:hypothetical protein
MLHRSQKTSRVSLRSTNIARSGLRPLSEGGGLYIFFPIGRQRVAHSEILIGEQILGNASAFHQELTEVGWLLLCVAQLWSRGGVTGRLDDGDGGL